MLGRVVVLVACGLAGCSQKSASSVPDAQPPDAMLDPACSDGIKNGTETDVDCGGTCRGCADGKVCAGGDDCANGTCFGGTCGDRMWFQESNGTSIDVPGNMTWTTAFGRQIQLLAPSLVHIRWTGTLRYSGGGNALCHVGQRFLINGMPTGDPNWGDAIMVERGASRWHEPFQDEIAMMMPAGIYMISAQMTNATGYATCVLDGDGGLPYDRSRLAIAAYDPTTAWYAESSAGTGPLGASSAWTDIPGVALTIPITMRKLVQVSLHGTQLAQTGTYAHCAYRLVVDDAPLGDPNHGQSIAVGDIGGGWWAPVAIKWGTVLDPGSHVVKAQVRNSSADGTCEAGQGNNAYAKFRMFASASPVGDMNQALESTGPSQVLGSSSAWTPIAGLATTITAKRAETVQIEVAGTQRTISGSGHCAYRLVLDNTPLGHVDHGQAIDVGDGSLAWWTYTGLTWGVKLASGSHDVRVEVRNSSTSGDCGVNGDDMPYGRVRMLVRHID